MKRNIIILTVVIIAFLTITLLFYLNRPKQFEADLTMESEAMSMVNYYIPNRIELTDLPAEKLLKVPGFISDAPKYGKLKLGNGTDPIITVILDETKQNSLLYIDKNNNEDLTDDDDPAWDEDKPVYRMKTVLIDVSYKEKSVVKVVPYPVVFYRYKLRFENAVIAYRDGFRKGTIALEDTTYKVALLDDDLNGLFDEFEKGTFIIDRNSDDVLDGSGDSDECFPLNAHFMVGQTAYKIKSISPAGDHLVLGETDTTVIQPTPLKEEMPAPDFKTTDFSGTTIQLTDFRNKVVLIDFWATWCKPWEHELADLQRTYHRYHARGFEIIGMNLDYDLDLMQAFIEKNKIRWPQITTGEGWDMPFVDLFHVRFLPKRFLIDRKGIIRYKDLPARFLRSKVSELLNEPGDADDSPE